MADEVIKKLLECGVHFGHQTRRWNPKMKRFIFGERNGIYIIDLEKTAQCIDIVRDFVRDLAAKGGKVLFVGTKKQAKDVIAAEAERAEMPYINNRWMGGLLTNFQTVRKSLEKLLKLERMEVDGTFEHLKKKEIGQLLKEKGKLLRDLGGIRDMRELPKAVFVVDSKREEIAVLEAVRLKLPVIGLIDTNCDPDLIEYPIPGNDDALKSIRYMTGMIADALLEGRKAFAEAQTIRERAATGEGAEVSESAAPSAEPSVPDGETAVSGGAERDEAAESSPAAETVEEKD